MPGLGASACTIGRQWRDKCHVCLLKSPPLGHDMVDPAPVLRWIKRFDENGNGKKQHLDLFDKVLAKETVHEPRETL